MTNRTILTYALGVLFALTLVSVAHGQNENGTSIDIQTDVDDNLKYDQFVNVMLSAGQTVVEVVQNVFGYSNPDDLCCMVGTEKKQDGERWTGDNGEDCVCNAGNVACETNNMTTP
ncbi:hypothetical protein SK128_007385 [Halocaridina rubra]|uniref:Uncharacterized protein n=1 Tax=Halocaridina rubra TaxID=373956 RepID=A0AAN8WZ22_HALRR